MPHISDARSAKSSFQLTTLLSLVKQTAIGTVAKNLKPNEPVWDAIGSAISQVIQTGGKLLPLVLEAENVTKSKYCYHLFFRSTLIKTISYWNRALGYQVGGD
jgi:hypothetical protein